MSLCHYPVPKSFDSRGLIHADSTSFLTCLDALFRFPYDYDYDTPGESLRQFRVLYLLLSLYGP